MDRAPQPEPSCHEHDDDGERDEHECENRRRLQREECLVAHVDPGCERRVAHERDRPEVGQDVQSDEQRRGRERGPERRKRHAEEHLEPAGAEAARGLLRRGIDASQARRGKEENIRVGRERQGEQSTPVPVQLGNGLDAERLERLLEQAARSERAEERERGDEARDDEWERGGEAPEPPAGQIRANDEPGERDADGQCRGHDPGAEQGGGDHELDRGRHGDERPGVRVGGECPQSEVCERERRRARDDAGDQDEEERRATAGRRVRGRRAAAHLM